MTCSVSHHCLNNQKCFHCCFDEDRFSEYGQNLYNPIGSIRELHPIQRERQDEARQEKIKAKQEQKKGKAELRKQEKIANEKSKDKTKAKIIKNAAKKEAKVIATINSGRIGQNGDARADDITIDVKHQSTSKDWQVNRDEYLKVQNDALRGNRAYGVLAVTNKLDETVYVIPAELFNILLEYMKE